MFLVVLPIFLQVATPAQPVAPGVRVLRLDDAVETALKNQPTLQQARAQTHAAEGRVTQARSAFFPQLNATASYQRVRSRASTAPSVNGTVTAVPTTDTSGTDLYSVGANATQLIWDWGTAYNRTRAASRFVDAFQANEKSSAIVTVADVRRSYFTARAQKALLGVSRDALANLEKHLVQIEGFVQVGTRPEIDLAQARTDVANGRLSLINAQNAYAVSRAELGRAIGLPNEGEFDVADDGLPAIDGEEIATDRLVARAVAGRPEMMVLDKQRQANELLAKGYRGNYGPTLLAAGSISETGTALGDLGPAWAVGLTLNWPVFQGGLTHGQVREAESNADLSRAQGDTERLQIRFEVQQAQLGIQNAKASQAASNEVLANAKERLRLAEGRYASGVGSAIELGDAQLAVTQAAAQVVQAEFQLSSARADLLAALGQR